MPAKAASVPATCRGRRRSTPSRARINSVNSGPLVSTSDEENAVDMSMPQVTMPTCAVWPTRPAAAKRGQSPRSGTDLARCLRYTSASSAKPSSGSVRKRMKRNGPTSTASSTYLVIAKFAPHTTMIAIAASRESCEAVQAIEAEKVH